jgi:hypothetical protein
MTCRLIVLCSWPLFFACEKQGPSADAEEAEKKQRADVSAHVSQSRRAHAATSSHSQEKTADEVRIKEAWVLVYRDPVAAWTMVENISDRRERQLILDQCATSLAERDRSVAIEWANHLPMEEEKKMALARIAVVWSAEEPMPAAVFLQKQNITGLTYEIAAVEILQFWAQRSGPEAAAWALSFPASPLRLSGLDAVSSQWFERDAAEFGRWLAAEESASVRDEFIASSARVITPHIAEKRQAYLRDWPQPLRERVEAAAEPLPP